MTQTTATNEPTKHPLVIARYHSLQATECQCDACPPSAPLASAARTYAPSDNYALSPTITTVRLDDRHWTAYAPAASAGPVVLNDPALSLLRRFEHPRPLHTVLTDRHAAQDVESTKAALSTMRQARLLVPVSCPWPLPGESPQTLTAWLHVTRNCNLRCSYCYLDAAAEDMSHDVGDCAIDAVFRSASKQHMSSVKLKYAGGEPTLAFPTVSRLHRRAIQLAKEHSLGLDGVVISNGVGVTAEMLRTIQALGLRLAISLDGLGSHHDCQRPLADGTGSFATVSQTIERALSSGIVPDISVTITGRNLAGIPELTEWLLDQDLPFGLGFYRENDTAAFKENLRLDKERVIETMQRVFQIIERRLPRRSLLASLLDRTNLAWPHTRSCSVGTNYLVIDTQGHIAKCQMDIGHTITDISASDPLADIRAAQTGIQNLPVDEKADCQECQWRYWCGGGCPLEVYRTSGRWNARSPYCTIYRTLFPEVLRLEGLRLLKHAEHA